MLVNSDECQAAGVDEKEVARIARGIERYVKDAKKIGLNIFGGSSLSLRFEDGKGIGELVVADMDCTNVDGGCGAYGTNQDGLLRGEF